MNDFMLEMVLRHFEFDDAQIARIKAAIPKGAYLVNLAKHNKTVTNELIDVVSMVLNQINKEHL